MEEKLASIEEKDTWIQINGNRFVYGQNSRKEGSQFGNSSNTNDEWSNGLVSRRGKHTATKNDLQCSKENNWSFK